jgi:hypothetical protein
MSWTIAGKYVRASATDPDAQAYLQTVEAVDGQALEFEVARAIDNFVLGCKQDGIWSAIKASCILAGARTLTGALVPLAGTAPTNFNFVPGDYNRKTGLVGDGSTKYLDANYQFLASINTNKHAAAFVSTKSSSGTIFGSADTSGTDARTQIIHSSADNLLTRMSSNASTTTNNINVNGLQGMQRSASASYSVRSANSNTVITNTSVAPADENSMNIYRRNILVSPVYSNARLAFYSFGESLDLALLDARVTDLINAFDTAIPS